MKSQLLHLQPWNDIDDIEAAMDVYINCYNNERIVIRRKEPGTIPGSKKSNH